MSETLRASLTPPSHGRSNTLEVAGSQDGKAGSTLCSLTSGLCSPTLKRFHFPIFLCPFCHLVPKCQGVMTGPASLAILTIVPEPKTRPHGL